MEINIAPMAGIVIVDGVPLNIDLTSLSTIQGMHWDGNSGEVAYWNPDTKKMLSNETITDISAYQWVIEAYAVEKERIAQEKLKIEQEKAKIEENKLIAEAKEATDSLLNKSLSTRLSLLIQSDWTQLPDVPLSLEKKQEWAVYRQILRDLPSNPDFPNVPFPTTPQ